MSVVARVLITISAASVIGLVALDYLSRLPSAYQLQISCATSCGTFADYERSDVFCVFDPTCVSPLFRSDDLATQNWTGTAYWRLGMERSYPMPWKAFAIPNYLAFMAVVTATTAVAIRYMRRAAIRLSALIAVLVFCSVAIVRWFVGLQSAPWLSGQLRAGALHGEMAVVFIFSFMAIGLTTAVAGPKSRHGQTKIG